MTLQANRRFSKPASDPTRPGHLCAAHDLAQPCAQTGLNPIENHFNLNKLHEEEKKTKRVAETRPWIQQRCLSQDTITLTPIGKESV